MELTDSLKTLLIETAKSRKGSARRFFMARTVKELGPGGQPRAARERRWGRRTMRKGRHELDRGVPCVDAFALRGRKRAAEHLPNLLTDLDSGVFASLRWVRQKALQNWHIISQSRRLLAGRLQQGACMLIAMLTHHICERTHALLRGGMV
jgi:hypothetical protein